ncbi:hypothetical protein [Campylobacter gracilis]|uniref:Uncharacterized protein n=1 Tax=Campylobacter gracilis RM3268 TaxID=553220 RepID=C8PH66_9BACT|nr:hypothetical protein [Campylobacter gracilis]EEV17887.1 hypothetical protein CAMGR0001_2254 [Campylobacter gracilis RM3268]UEB46453.1 hypothetical protein LK410_05040 [Campylobacter gracilis]
MVKISKFYRLCARNCAENFSDAMRTVYLGILPQDYFAKRRKTPHARQNFGAENFCGEILKFKL